jgi:hypothetical protein
MATAGTRSFQADKLELQEAVLKKLVRSGNPSDRQPELELEEVKKRIAFRDIGKVSDGGRCRI